MNGRLSYIDILKNTICPSPGIGLRIPSALGLVTFTSAR